jgi:hypothetical protein
MQNVWLGYIVLLADVLESAGSSIVSIADDHLVLHHQRTYLAALAVAVFSPDASHAQVAQVELLLFRKLIFHPSTFSI